MNRARVCCDNLNCYRDMRRNRSRGILILVSMTALILAAGCGLLRGKDPVYVQSEELPPIEVPPDLHPPPVQETFTIPGYFLPELAAQGDESLPPRVLPSAEAEAARSRIRFGPTGLYLEVDDEASSVWRRLGFTLNRDGMSVQEVNESERRYRFRFQHEPITTDRGFFSRLLFWRGADVIDYSGEYMLEIHRDGTRTRVALLDDDGSVIDMNRAEFVLARLRERLG